MAGTRDFGNFRFWKIVRVLFFKNPQKNVFENKSVLSGSKFPLLAIHKIISHIWEDGSRKVNNDEPDLRFFSRKLLTCYQPDSSKTLFFDLNPKGAKSGKPGRAKLLGHTVDCRRHGLLWARTAGAHCGLLKAQTPVRARTANMTPTRGPIYI